MALVTFARGNAATGARLNFFDLPKKNLARCKYYISLQCIPQFLLTVVEKWVKPPCHEMRGWEAAEVAVRGVVRAQKRFFVRTGDELRWRIHAQHGIPSLG
jgi:hypothetical protein